MSTQEQKGQACPAPSSIRRAWHMGNSVNVCGMSVSQALPSFHFGYSH